MILVLSMLAMLLPSEIGSIIAHAAENHFAVVAEKDFTIQNGVVKSYDGSTTDVVIPDGTTSIAEAAFYFDENITSVTIPDSVTRIDAIAFRGCKNLKRVKMGKSVRTIGNAAFMDCKSLTDVTLSDTLVTVGRSAFENCTSLQRITIPDSVVSMGKTVFQNCTSLQSVSIPDSVMNIGDSAFNNCASLNSVKIGNSVSMISENAFYKCTSLKSVVIPDSVSLIDYHAFQECTALKSATIGNNVITIQGDAFIDCTSLESVKIGNSVKTIGNSAFLRCTNLQSVTIPDSVTSIGVTAFQNCKGIKTLKIGNSVKEIKRSAFENCTSMTSATIGNSVETIGNGAFKNCSSLQKITIPDSVTTIGDSAFENCTAMTELKIGKSVMYIGGSAFKKCSSLQSLSLPDSVLDLGGDAFASCSGMKTLRLSHSLTKIAWGAFWGCGSLENVVVPDSVTVLDHYAFAGCGGMKSITLPPYIENILYTALTDCGELEDIYFGGSQTQWERVNHVEFNKVNGWINHGVKIHSGYNTGSQLTQNNAVLKLDKTQMNVAMNKSVTLHAAVNKKIVANEILTWRSDDETVATVSKSGKVTGVKPGETIVYAKTPDGHVAQCEVSVNIATQNLSIKAEDINLGPPLNKELNAMSVEFLNKKFNLFRLDVGYKMELKHFSCAYDPQEQKLVVKIGKLRDAKDDGKQNKELWLHEYREIKQFYQEVLHQKVNTTQLYESFANTRAALKASHVKFAFEFNSTMYGYMEFDCSSGEPRFSEGGLAIGSNISVSFKYKPYPIFYAKIGFKGELETKGGFHVLRVADSEPQISLIMASTFSLTPELSLGAELGIGSFTAASIGGGARGKFSISLSNGDLLGFNGPSKSSLTIKYQGCIFLEATVLGHVAATWEKYYPEYLLFSHEWSSTDTTSSKSSVTQSGVPKYGSAANHTATDNTASASQFTLVPRAKPSIRNTVAPKNYKTAVGQNLVSNVYPYSEPQMLQLSDGKVLAVWIGDDTSRSEINRTALMYTYYNGSSWSAVKQVNHDGTADFSPKLIPHGSGAYLVWQNADAAFSDGKTMLETASHYNIFVAYFNGSTFTDIRNVNDYDNSTLEVQPLLISDGTNLTSVWVEATDNYVFGEQTKFTLCKASANASAAGVGAGKRVVLAANISNLSSIDAAYLNGDEYILYSTSESDKIHLIKNGTESTLSGVSSNFRIVDGKLFWFTDGVVKSAPLSNLSSVTETPIAFSGSAEDIQFLRNTNGGQAMIWKQVSNMENELFVSYYDSVNKAWGQGVQITHCGAAITDYAATLDNQNRISYIMETREVVDGQASPYGEANLVMNSYTKVTDVKAEGVYYHATEIVPDASVDFTTEVVNVGTQTVSKATVDLLDASGNVIGTTVYDKPLLSGQSAYVSVSATLPADLATFGVKMRVTAQGDVDTSNNTTAMQTFARPNVVLAVSDVSKTNKDGSHIRVKVSNKGLAAANDITVSLYKENTDTEPVATQTIDSLDINKSKEITFDVAADQLTETEFPYKNQFVVSASIEEEETLYTDNSQVCQVESVRVNQITIGDIGELKPNETRQVGISVLSPNNAVDRSLSYYTSDNRVATVDANGLVTAVAPGKATIRVVTNDRGLYDERQVIVTPPNLTISEQPGDVTAKAGASVTFAVTAKGDGLTYQWYYLKSGQTAWKKWETRTTPSTTAEASDSWDGMQVYCAVTDKYHNTVNSRIATVTVRSDLVISTQPTDQTAVSGKPVTLSLQAKGTGLIYQWYYKKAGQTSWSKWSGRTHASETVTPNESWNGIQLYCVVIDSTGKTVQSDTVTVTVTQGPKITAQPVSQKIKLGNSLTISLKAEGVGLTYQWYYKKAGQTSWNAWNGRTHASETVTPNESWNGILFYCKVKDSANKTVQSNTVKVLFTDLITVVKQPANVTAKTGSNITVAVGAEGVGLTYQWYYKKAGQTSWSKWNGRTKASETVAPNASWDGMQLYCLVTNSAGKSVKSGVAKVTLSDVLAVTQQPSNVTAKTGQSISLSVKAKGAGLTYQWYYKKAGQTSWSAWNGRTHASETVTPNESWNGIQFYCRVRDSANKTVQSNTVKVLFTDVVTVVKQPANVTAKTGTNITVAVGAEGVGLTYQWYYKKAGTTAWSKWNGRTKASETVAPNASWDGMQLYCLVTNAAGKSVKSGVAKVTLADVLAVTQQPSNVTAKAGQSISFSVKAKGAGLTYQWYYKKEGQTSWSKWGTRTTASTTATANATWNGMQVRCVVKDNSGKTVTSGASTITIK